MKQIIEAELARFGVPGAAVSVVVNGETLLAEGFGLKDTATGARVTAQTQFFISSDTKCFAAAMLCLLADQGLVDLDAPIRDHVAWFAMWDQRINDLVTARDLLAHRTGLPRHDFFMIGDHEWSLSNEEAMRRLRHLEPVRGFREGFGYHNAHFAAAGYLTEVLTGEPWAASLDRMLLEPLGMTATRLYDPSLYEGDFALPYHEIDGSPALQEVLARPLLEPNGGIVSTAQDMTLWLKARLGGGELFSPSALALLHTPCALMGTRMAFGEIQPLGYGLGTMVSSYRGRQLLHHGGNSIGYRSEVVVVPAEGIGIAVLANQSDTNFPTALALTLVDRLLGSEPAPWGERLNAAEADTETVAEAGRPPARPLADYVGTYLHPAYGELVIALEGGVLVPRYHGIARGLVHRDLDVWELRFETYPQVVPIVFRSGAAGPIVELAATFEPAVSPLVFARQP